MDRLQRSCTAEHVWVVLTGVWAGTVHTAAAERDDRLKPGKHGGRPAEGDRDQRERCRQGSWRSKVTGKTAAELDPSVRTDGSNQEADSTRNYKFLLHVSSDFLRKRGLGRDVTSGGDERYDSTVSDLAPPSGGDADCNVTRHNMVN